MEVNEFKEKGCYVCLGKEFDQPFIPLDPDNGNLPARDPFLRCTNCDSEFPFPDIALLDDESWNYGHEHRSGNLAIPTTYYHSEVQFSEAAKARGWVNVDEEDVPRPG